MLGDLWAHPQFPADMYAGQAGAWLQADEQEATPESVPEIVELSGSMDEFEFVPDPNAHLGVMGGGRCAYPNCSCPARGGSRVRLTRTVNQRRAGCPPFPEPSRPPGQTGGSPTPTRSGSPLTRAAAHPGQARRPGARAMPAPAGRNRGNSEPHDRGWRYEHIYMHPAQDHLKGVRLPRPGPVLQVSAALPVDLGRYNQPVADTRTQRRK